MHHVDAHRNPMAIGSPASTARALPIADCRLPIANFDSMDKLTVATRAIGNRQLAIKNMRILLSSEHRYPAFGDVGAGPHPTPYPSGSGFWIHDLLAKDSASWAMKSSTCCEGRGETVAGGRAPLLPKPVWDADILHTISDHDERTGPRVAVARQRPWVSTCHIDMRTRGLAQRPTTDNWIFVSRTLARRHGRQRFVLNGVDPAACIYDERKARLFPVHVVYGLGDEERTRHRDLARGSDCASIWWSPARQTTTSAS